MRPIFYILIFGLSSCVNESDKVEGNSLSDKKSVFNHPDNFTTPSGQEIRFLVSGNKYYVQWRQGDTLTTLDFPFDIVENGNSSFPRLISENNNYILLRSGCGNPCWLGLFLPLDKNRRPEIVHEYISFDLNTDLVAYILDSDSIAILNLKTGKKEYFAPGKCEAAFPGYCIDTAYFKDNKFYYAWISKTTIDSNQTAIKEYMLTK